MNTCRKLPCRSLWLAGACAVVAFPVTAGAEGYDYHKKTLSNGLTVLTLEDHSCPIVAVQVWYHVGSKNENENRQGFAHMFEHMMFRGTDVLDGEAHTDYIRGTGGDCNAYTTFDNTTYINELPASQLALALWLEAERMAFLKIDALGFFKERNVVEEERRMRSLNTPYGSVPEKVLPVLFKEHPYRWSTIGQIPHLRAATIDELQAFWDKYYVPANATLVIVGDIKHDQAQALAEQYFGWIPAMAKPAALDIVEPSQTAAQSVTIKERKGPVPIVGILYRGVPQGHADELPLDMIMRIVGGGESSRLYLDLVKEREIAQAAVAGAFGLEDDGLMGAGAVIMPWGNKQNALAAVREHLQRVHDEGVTQRELDKVKNQLLAEEVRSMRTVASKAAILGEYEVIQGDAGKAGERLGRIRSVTPEDIQRVASRYLVAERETAVIVEPQIGGLLKSLFGIKDVDEGAEPVPEPTENRVASRGGLRANLVRPERFPVKPPVAALGEVIPAEVATHDTVLGNGLRVVIIANHEVPYVSLRLGIKNGAWTESKPGTASMAARMITQGTTRHTAKELAEELEFNAISLSGSASLDVSTVSASCVSDKFSLAVELLAEVVKTPVFPEKELDILRQQTLLNLMVSARTPEYLADGELRRRLFGDHPYARTATGESNDVQALTQDDIKKWWRTYVRPDASVLYIAGDVQADAAVEMARKVLEDWVAVGDPPVVTLADPPDPQATHIYVVDRPGSVQSQIRVGHRAITRQDQDYFTCVVLSQIFGGAFNSRLNKAVRVDEGLTYGARGGFSARRFAGTFRASTFTKTPKTAEALNILLRETRNMEAAAPAADELNMNRSFLLGSFAGDRETPADIAADLWLIDYAGLPKDYFTRFLAGVKKTSAADVERVAKRLILADQLTIVVVGQAATLKPELENIAPVTVVNVADALAQPRTGQPQSP